MKKSEFKALVKEVVKECVHEAILESGILSNIISEVIRGTMKHANTFASPNNNLLDEQVQTKSIEIQKEKQLTEEKQSMNKKLVETKKKLLESIGKEGYNGVNLFEGTTPAPVQRELSITSAPDPLQNIDPADSGVDISNIMKFSNVWNTLAKGKKGV
jgi:hypothetical protein